MEKIATTALKQIKESLGLLNKTPRKKVVEKKSDRVLESDFFTRFSQELKGLKPKNFKP